MKTRFWLLVTLALLATPALHAAGVVYYPVYPAPYAAGPYRAPAWASPSAAALGPWKWNLNVAGGPSFVTGGNSLLQNGGNFQMGGGYNFSPRVGLVFEFGDAWLGVSDRSIADRGALNGDANVWSFTVNPTWRFRIAGPIGGYLIGGGGFYERVLHFDVPVQVFIPDFGGGGSIVSGINHIHETDDTGGLNAGAGLTWNWGWGTKFFVEARYHYVFTSGKATQYIPVNFGFRW